MLLPVLAVLFATGFGVTAVLGGLDTVPDPPPQQLKPKDTLDQGQFHTQFVEAVYTFVSPKTRFQEEKHRVDLVFKVTNLSDSTTSVGNAPRPGQTSLGPFFASSILKTEPPLPSKIGGIGVVISQGVESNQLHPDVTSTVVVRYPIEGAFQPPEQITLDMGAFEYRANGILLVPHWFPVVKEVDGEEVPQTVARVTLPVRQEAA